MVLYGRKPFKIYCYFLLVSVDFDLCDFLQESLFQSCRTFNLVSRFYFDFPPKSIQSRSDICGRCGNHLQGFHPSESYIFIVQLLCVELMGHTSSDCSSHETTDFCGRAAPGLTRRLLISLCGRNSKKTTEKSH